MFVFCYFFKHYLGGFSFQVSFWSTGNLWNIGASLLRSKKCLQQGQQRSKC